MAVFTKIAPFETSVLSKYATKTAKVFDVFATGNLHCTKPDDLLSLQIPHCKMLYSIPNAKPRTIQTTCVKLETKIRYCSFSYNYVVSKIRAVRCRVNSCKIGGGSKGNWQSYSAIIYGTCNISPLLLAQCEPILVCISTGSVSKSGCRIVPSRVMMQIPIVSTTRMTNLYTDITSGSK